MLHQGEEPHVDDGQAEEARRDGIQIAHFAAVKTLDELGFKFQPSIDAKLVRELATGSGVSGQFLLAFDTDRPSRPLPW